jgi:hypothetical protein
VTKKKSKKKRDKDGGRERRWMEPGEERVKPKERKSRGAGKKGVKFAKPR